MKTSIKILTFILLSLSSKLIISCDNNISQDNKSDNSIDVNYALHVWQNPEILNTMSRALKQNKLKEFKAAVNNMLSDFKEGSRGYNEVKRVLFSFKDFFCIYEKSSSGKIMLSGKMLNGNNDGWLHYAAVCKAVDVAGYLLANGLSLDAPNNRGNTPRLLLRQAGITHITVIRENGPIAPNSSQIAAEVIAV